MPDAQGCFCWRFGCDAGEQLTLGGERRRESRGLMEGEDEISVNVCQILDLGFGGSKGPSAAAPSDDLI